MFSNKSNYKESLFFEGGIIFSEISNFSRKNNFFLPLQNLQKFLSHLYTRKILLISKYKNYTNRATEWKLGTLYIAKFMAKIEKNVTVQ